MTKTRKLIIILITVSVFFGCSSGDTETNSPAPSATASPVPIVVDETSRPAPSASPTPVAAETPRYTDYNVSMEYFPDSGEIAVVERIKYRNQTGRQLERIYLNVYLNAFAEGAAYKPYFESFEKKIFESGADYSRFAILSVISGKAELEHNLNDTVLTINLVKPLEPGDSIEIILSFEAYISKINHRTGRNDYAAWFGNFLPVLAVYDENGWHTEQYYQAGDPFYSECSNYSVKITVPSGYTVVATGEESMVEADGKRITSVSAKMVRDFAFAVSGSYRIESAKTASGPYVNLYYYSDVANAAEILAAAARAVDYYSSNVAPYPYTSLDIIETGMFLQSGMAYPELCFAESSSLSSKELTSILTHGIGHQWFYNIIGNNQIKEAWLDEGLTAYMAQAALLEPEQLDEIIRAEYVKLAERLREFENKTLLNDISVFQSWDEYEAVNCSRAKLMFCSLANRLGGEKFDAFLRLYYSRCSFGVANRQQLIAVAEEASGESLADFFSAWTGDYILPPLDQRKIVTSTSTITPEGQ